MAGLSVTEKEHWKNRIARRIDKRIEAILAEEPNFNERVQQQAREQALTSLGLAEAQSQLDQIEHDRSALERQERQLKRTMLAHVRGVPVDTLDSYADYHAESEVERAVTRRQAVLEDQILAESDLGKRILRLRAEREELLDVVWLATSPAQLKQLWSKVNELLSAEISDLEREALAIPAAAE